VDFGGVRPRRQHLPVARHGFLETSLPQQQVGQAILCVDELLIERERALIALARLGEFFLLLEQIGQAAMRLGIVVPQRDGPPQMRSSLLEMPARAQSERQVEMTFRSAAVGSNGASEQLDRLFVVRGLQGDDAEQMQAVEMIALDCERVAAQALGRRNLPGAKLLERRGKQLRAQSSRGGSARGDAGAPALLFCRPPLFPIHGNTNALIASQCRPARSRPPIWRCRLADAFATPAANRPWPRSRDRRNAP
jgi:hypothetical protein